MRGDEGFSGSGGGAGAHFTRRTAERSDATAGRRYWQAKGGREARARRQHWLPIPADEDDDEDEPHSREGSRRC